MVEKTLLKELKAKINKTFFNSSVIYINDPIFKDMPEKIDFYIQYTFIGEKKTHVKKHSASKTATKTEYKLSCGKDFAVAVAAKSFGASKAAWYLSNDFNLNIGEYLVFELKEVDNDKYYLIAKGAYNLPDTQIVTIDGDDYSARKLRKIANTFIPRYSGAATPNKNQAEKVLWNNPTDWIDYDENSDDFKQSLKVYNAVYMWIGRKENDNDNRYIYVGMVGDDNNINNSVGMRMKQHIKDKDIIMECFRYSELVNAGNNDKVEVLKTVEMQCINMVSGLIQGKNEPIIHGKIDQASMNNCQYMVSMPNKSVRYQQGFGSGDLKAIY